MDSAVHVILCSRSEHYEASEYAILELQLKRFVSFFSGLNTVWKQNMNCRHRVAALLARTAILLLALP